MIEAYAEQLITIDELRTRMPHLRAREANLRSQLDALDAQAADQDAYLKLADDLDGFLAQLRGSAATASISERQRVLRLLVKDVLIGPEKITIRHRIPVRERTSSGGGHHDSTDTEGDMRKSYPLCWGRGLPAMRRMELLGAFGLTEPEVGSGVVRGLTTTARREGDTWVLDGEKKWIGNATFSDLTIIWARDVADDQVKGFVVEKDAPGFTAVKMEDKIALRVVQNAHITLDGCRVPEANRLAKARSFRDTARVLRMTRADVAWLAVGCARGAYEHALRYARKRHQFGRPIGGFQLVQDLLARMLGNTVASECLLVRLSQLEDAGALRDEQAALAKGYCTARTRETTSWARELLAGNGILLDNHVGRFVADSEAIYSYEGTREINSLIVGRAITGFGAFV